MSQKVTTFEIYKEETGKSDPREFMDNIIEYKSQHPQLDPLVVEPFKIDNNSLEAGEYSHWTNMLRLSTAMHFISWIKYKNSM